MEELSILICLLLEEQVGKTIGCDQEMLMLLQHKLQEVETRHKVAEAARMQMSIARVVDACYCLSCPPHTVPQLSTACRLSK